MNEQVLILGSPGSGKTFLASQARQRGFNAFDADAIPGLHGWFGRGGEPVEFPDHADVAFFEEHRFLWRRPVPERFLNAHPDALVFGIATNAFEMLDLFACSYFLRVSDSTLCSRLRHPSRVNPMGATLEQQRVVLDAARADLESATAAGVMILDGEAPVARILATIGGC